MSAPNSAAESTLVRDVFGHRLRAFLPLPAPVVAPGPVDWDFVLGAATAPVAAEAPTAELRPLAADVFEARGLARVFFRPGEIAVHPEAGARSEDLVGLLTGTLTALLTARTGHLVLHGTTLRFGDRLVVLCGMAGAGKSTQAAYLALYGRPLHADDIAPVIWRDGAPVMFPGFDSLRLFPDSLALLGRDADALPVVNSRTNKRLATLGTPRAGVGRALPVAGVVLLEEAAEFALEPLPARAAVVALLNFQHPTAAHAVDGSAATRARAFADCARLAQDAEVLRLRRPKTRESLERCAAALATRFDQP